MSKYDVWQKANEQNAPNLIITGAKGDTLDKGFGPSTKFIEWMDNTYKTLLDFGAGIGRNTFALASKYPVVHAFDFPNMIEMLEKRKHVYLQKETYLSTFTDWNKVKTYQYDAIFTSLVLQHIHPEDLTTYSNEFIKMTDTLYLFSRWYTDFIRKSVYEILSVNWEIVSIFPQKEKAVNNDLVYEIEKIKNAKNEDHYACKMKRKEQC